MTASSGFTLSAEAEDLALALVVEEEALDSPSSSSDGPRRRPPRDFGEEGGEDMARRWRWKCWGERPAPFLGWVGVLAGVSASVVCALVAKEN